MTYPRSPRQAPGNPRPHPPRPTPARPHELPAASALRTYDGAVTPPDDASHPSARPSRVGRYVAAAIALAGVLVLGAYGIAVAMVSGSEVPQGSTVLGVPIGGKDQAAAVATLSAELGAQASADIPVSAATKSAQVSPAQAGLGVDWDATVAQATGRVWNPAELVSRLTGATVEVDPVVTTDDAAMSSAVTEIGKAVKAKPVEPTIAYSDSAKVLFEPGSVGTTLEPAGAAAAIQGAYLVAYPYSPVALPVTTTAPAVSDATAQQVVDTVAKPAVALPITVAVSVAADKQGAKPDVTTMAVSEAEIATILTFAPSGSTLAATVDGKALRALLDDELSKIEGKPKDASIVIEGGKPVIKASKTGAKVATKDLAAAVEKVLPATTKAQRVAEVAAATVAPQFSTADAKALNIKEKLSSFRQAFPPAAYRYQNVGQAAAYMNGTILKPGDTFSMNGTVHERTRANGYTEGFIISGGRFREELGGGVSIITTATWTAGFYAGLERVEQHPHGLYISRYQAGLEATVAWGLLDLRMRNDTGNGVLITAKRFNDGVLIEMWGTKKFSKVTSTFTPRTRYTDFRTIEDDSASCVPSAGVRGFSIAVTRHRFIGDKVFSRETWPTTYKPTPHVVCTNPNASDG